MSYLDFIPTATQRALDADFPPELLPLVIISEATQLNALSFGAMGRADWD